MRKEITIERGPSNEDIFAFYLLQNIGGKEFYQHIWKIQLWIGATATKTLSHIHNSRDHYKELFEELIKKEIPNFIGVNYKKSDSTRIVIEVDEYEK